MHLHRFLCPFGYPISLAPTPHVRVLFAGWRSGIVMIEDEARTITLRDLEAAYLREVLVNDRLQDHLGAANRMQYTGACRSLTNRIPMASIQILSVSSLRKSPLAPRSQHRR